MNAEVCESYECCEKPDTKTGISCLWDDHYDDYDDGDCGMICERFGPSELAGTFEITTDSAAVCRPEAKSLVEFAVWKTAKSYSCRRVLWFTARKEMSVASAIAVRALKIWTDRNNGYPSKVVFLKEWSPIINLLCT